MADRYTPPVQDIRFALEHLAGAKQLSALPGLEHADLDTMTGLLEEFGRFCAEVLAPLNRVGDEVGSTLDPATGEVTTPPGWREAYAKYVDAGWGSVPFPVEHGGGGFPWLLATAMQELLTAANMAFSLGPLLTQGAIHLLELHGSEDQQARFLTRMVTGEWTGTMNLTEPQAGSDLGAITTRAVPAEDGTWRISGQKIYITYGEHDLTDNVVHLVLARAPEAPPGTRGISCFIVPKHLVDADGVAGARNGVRCIGIEHKMGIHGSPTCTLEFDDAVGELVGERDGGMRAMFTMMNPARLSVGLEGLAIAERAFQAASDYAHERVQGRALGAEKGTTSPIIDHEDVRRMLVHMKAHIEAMRGVAYLNAAAIDAARHGADEADRTAGQELADLLTPVTKAWCTDLGSELARLATQVHGGMGYITETGVEQHERDIRIAAIYEGTNGIQAADLVFRKVPMRTGGVVADLAARIRATADELDAAGMADLSVALRAGVDVLDDASRWLFTAAGGPRDMSAGATPYLRIFGTVLGGWMMGHQALAATGQARGGPSDAARVARARWYLTQVLPTAAALVPAVTGGADVLADALGDVLR
jgi:alkylation response protein AidB-like acyl-CoA dehydrogenase